MTLTSTQQAAASASQIIQQGNNIIRQIQAIKNTVANGAPANAAASLPGFSTADLDAALGTANLAVINALIAALPTA